MEGQNTTFVIMLSVGGQQTKVANILGFVGHIWFLSYILHYFVLCVYLKM